MNLPTFEFEQQCWSQGLTSVAGVDEVGRGALAGPIVAAAVVFDANHSMIAGVNDSKKLTSNKRTSLADLIKQQSHCWAIGVGDVKMINDQGIVYAQKYAMNQALNQLTACQHILIDGLPFKKPLDCNWEVATTFIVKGDQKSYSIAAASIVAKVYRDELMKELATEYPEYGWETNVGYGSTIHRQAIKNAGLTAHHRTLFCRKTLNAT